MTHPVDLRQVLLAIIIGREHVANAATPGPWMHVDYASPPGQHLTIDGLESTYMGCGSVITMGEQVMGANIAAPNGDLYPRGGYKPREDMRFMAVHNPEDARSRYAHYRSILERHVAKEPYWGGGELFCIGCGFDEAQHYRHRAHECPEVHGVARALLPAELLQQYGIEVDE